MTGAGILQQLLSLPKDRAIDEYGLNNALAVFEESDEARDPANAEMLNQARVRVMPIRAKTLSQELRDAVAMAQGGHGPLGAAFGWRLRTPVALDDEAVLQLLQQQSFPWEAAAANVQRIMRTELEEYGKPTPDVHDSLVPALLEHGLVTKGLFLKLWEAKAFPYACTAPQHLVVAATQELFVIYEALSHAVLESRRSRLDKAIEAAGVHDNRANTTPGCMLMKVDTELLISAVEALRKVNQDLGRKRLWDAVLAAEARIDGREPEMPPGPIVHATFSEALSSPNASLSDRRSHYSSSEDCAALCENPMWACTGVHVMEVRVTSIGNCYVGMMSPSTRKDGPPGRMGSSIGLSSGGAVYCDSDIQKASDSARSFPLGALVRLEYDSGARTLRWLRDGTLVYQATDVPEGWHFAVDLRLEGTSTAGRLPPNVAACLETLEGAMVAAEKNANPHEVDASLLQFAQAKVEPLRKAMTEAPLRVALADASLEQPTSLTVLDEEIAAAEGRTVRMAFEQAVSNHPEALHLSEADSRVRVVSSDVWAITKQKVVSTGSFSFDLVSDRLDDEGSCFGVVSEDLLGSLPIDLQEGDAPAGSAFLRCYSGKVGDSSGSTTDAAFKLHPGGTLRIEVNVGAGTATFFVNGQQHPHVARGIRGPMRGFFYRYGSRLVEARARPTVISGGASSGSGSGSASLVDAALVAGAKAKLSELRKALIETPLSDAVLAAQERIEGREPEMPPGPIVHATFSESLRSPSTTLSHGRRAIHASDDCAALCEFPIGASTGLHVMEVKVISIGNCYVGMMSPSSRRNEPPGRVENSVGISSGGAVYRDTTSQSMNDVARGFTEGAMIRLEYDSGERALRWLRDGTLVQVATEIPEGWHFAVGRWNGTVDLRLEGTSTAFAPPSLPACLETLEGAIMAAEANTDVHVVDASLLQRAKAQIEPLRKVVTEAPLKLALAEAETHSERFISDVGCALAVPLQDAIAAAEGRVARPVFEQAVSNQPGGLDLSEADSRVRITSNHTWAITKQKVVSTGSFSFDLVSDRLDDEGSCFGVVSEDLLGSLPIDLQEGDAPAGSAFLRCYSGKVGDSSGSTTDAAFKLHPGGTLRIEVNVGAGTATFFVNGQKHPHVARGIRGAVRGFFYRYGTETTVEARVRPTVISGGASSGGGGGGASLVDADLLRRAKAMVATLRKAEDEQTLRSLLSAVDDFVPGSDRHETIPGRPSIGDNVRILGGEYIGRVGRVVEDDEDSEPFQVEVSGSGDVSEWLRESDVERIRPPVDNPTEALLLAVAAVEANGETQVDQELLQRAMAKAVELTRRKVLGQLQDAIKGNSAELINMALKAARAITDVAADTVAAAEARLATLAAEAERKGAAVEALEAAKSVDELIAAFGLVSQAQSAFSDEELQPERERLGEMLATVLDTARDTVDDAERLVALGAAVAQAEPAAAHVKNTCEAFTHQLRRARDERVEIEQEMRLRQQRIDAGAAAELPEMPNQYKCPVTLDVMRDPVKATDGVTYERKAIEQHFEVNGAKSPVHNTMMPDESTTLIPDTTLRTLIHEFPLKEHERLMKEAAARKDADERIAAAEAAAATAVAAAAAAVTPPHPKRQRTHDELDGFADEIQVWIEAAGIKAADAAKIAKLLVDAGCETVEDIVKFVDSGNEWQKLEGIRPMHRVKMENKVDSMRDNCDDADSSAVGAKRRAVADASSRKLAKQGSREGDNK